MSSKSDTERLHWCRVSCCFWPLLSAPTRSPFVGETALRVPVRHGVLAPSGLCSDLFGFSRKSSGWSCVCMDRKTGQTEIFPSSTWKKRAVGQQPALLSSISSKTPCKRFKMLSTLMVQSWNKRVVSWRKHFTVVFCCSPEAELDRREWRRSLKAWKQTCGVTDHLFGPFGSVGEHALMLHFRTNLLCLLWTLATHNNSQVSVRAWWGVGEVYSRI